MTYAVHHLVTLALAWAAGAVMARSRWSVRAPRTGVLIWQAVALTAIMSLVGVALAVGLSPYRLGVVPALARFAADGWAGSLPAGMSAGHLLAVGAGVGLAGWLLAAFGLTCRALAGLRRRQRTLLRLVARPDPGAHEALVVEHPAVAAYCVPGRQATIVLSTGTLGLLHADELAAVLAHERAHVKERHDLALLPFTVLERAFPWIPAVRLMRRQVAALVEMRADDRAARAHGRTSLSSALRRFRASDRLPSPAGTLGGAEGDIDARLDRLTTPTRTSLPLRTLLLSTALTVASTPLSLFLLPM
ncbi:M56 family metallopeptidase [Nonomuraea jiangxiensis]|uniref:Peptidase family M48 n=1 Tax=Nonomuraea jiangxiensis TaxID=633440 RepID=A0A1G8A8M5_9ACTN|nr:M56 family metallopeptidase [Nonomuraea jiangxiensis]SDH17345.1 Peptidase family M48 [Nonomuraea jiangxiensis]